MATTISCMKTDNVSSQAGIGSLPQPPPSSHLFAGNGQQLSVPLQSLDTSAPPSRAPEAEDEVTQNRDPETPHSREFRAYQKWNDPKSNIPRYSSCLVALFNLGMTDASYGPLIPSIQHYYDISYTIVSLVFLSPFVGYGLAALMTDRLHLWIGRRGIAALAGTSRIVAFLALSLHPPYPAIVALLVLAGLGNGLLDSGWNAFVGNLANANELLGLMHGVYGIGATIAPVIATSMINKYGLEWFQFYYVMIGVVVAELVLSLFAFWQDSGAAFRQSELGSEVENPGRLKDALSHRVTWICSFFLLAYVGSEVSLGGWIVTFMIRIRHGQPFESGLTATGFWLGITCGRFILAFVTPRLGEGLAVSIYLCCAMGLQLLFWLVPQFIVSAVAIAFLGFFLGPLFPAAVIATTKLLPRRLHVGAVGFSSAVGGGGASLLPFAVGAIAERKGVQTLQPIILAFLGVLLALWLCLPKIPRRVHAD